MDDLTRDEAMVYIEEEIEFIVEPDGKVTAPRELPCRGCGLMLRRRPGNAYGCGQCGSYMIVDIPKELERTDA